MPVHEQRQEFKLLQEQIAGEPRAVKRPVAQADKLGSRRRLVVARSLANVAKCLESLQAHTSAVKGLTESQIHVIGPAAWAGTWHDVSRKVNPAFVAADHRDGIAGITVLRVSGHFRADLVVSIAEVVRTTRNVVVVDLINAAVTRQK